MEAIRLRLSQRVSTEEEQRKAKWEEIETQEILKIKEQYNQNVGFFLIF